jgi:hypothetical protein
MLPSPATGGGKSESLGLGRQPIGCEAQCDLVFARAREHSKPAQPTGAAHRTGILKPLRPDAARRRRSRRPHSVMGCDPRRPRSC